MNFPWNNNIASFVISLILINAVFGVLLWVYIKYISRIKARIILLSIYFLFLVSYLLGLQEVLIATAMGGSIILTVIFVANLGELRTFFANSAKKHKIKKKEIKVQKIFDSEAAYSELEKAVVNLSKTRTGALISFEKTDSLDSYLNNGVIINAPIKAELLETIFYTGTRLHDGAVIIKNNIIEAASVFYTPTTKPFATKYGSRHRAAIGFSEVTDAVTVVVSEETGRISVAYDGMIETVSQENFLKVFQNYMSASRED